MTASSQAGLRRAVLAGFLISGITGLIYQSIWIRMLTLIVGGTTAALTTVLIAFMGGLALGSFLFGALADRTRTPLRTYALLEMLIGAWALILPLIYGRVPAIYRALHAIDPEHGLPFSLLRFGLALACFGLPATLMGGTLPLIVRSLERRTHTLRVTVAEVYAINTFGATIGAFLAGFVVVPTLGLDRTLRIAALVNGGIGLWFWLGPAKAERHLEARVSSASDADASHPEGVPGGRDAAASGERPSSLYLVAFFLMGASSLSYEVLWNRLLGLSFGNSVYSVSTMLTSFLLGIALGSWWLRRAPADTLRTWTALGWLEICIAIAAPLTALALSVLPHMVQYLFLLPYAFVRLFGDGAGDLGFWLLQFILFLVGTTAMLVPTALMGISFPIAVRLYQSRGTGRAVGHVYAANTFGSIVGLALTGFVLIDALGTRGAHLGWCVVNGILGVSLIALGRRKERARIFAGRDGAAAALSCLLVGIGLSPPWDIRAMTSGVYYHPIELSSPTLEGAMTYLEEDDLGLVSIHHSRQPNVPGWVTTLKVNGKFMAEDGQRLPVLHLDAHVPTLLHGPGARNALVIGLGGGYTVEAALRHPFERVDVAEISHAVVDAARIIRPAIFEDPRLHVVEADARSFLLTGETRYDVIISETSDPWMTGVSNLYTRECFEWVRDRLAPGGVFGTWLQTRHKRVKDVKLIVRTMARVFSSIAVFQPEVGDLLIVMSNDPLSVDASFLRRRFERLEDEFRLIHMRSPWQVLGRFALGTSSTLRWAGDGPINTDDRPIIEFNTPRTLNIGLKGQEVWDSVLEAAVSPPDLPLRNAKPHDVERLELFRALHRADYSTALGVLNRLERSGGEADPLMRARILFGLKDYARCADALDHAPPSERRAILRAGVLLFQGRYTALKAHLLNAPDWDADALDARDPRIALRRRELLIALGASPSEMRRPR